MKASSKLALELKNLMVKKITETSAEVTWSKPEILIAGCSFHFMSTLTPTGAKQNCTDTSCLISGLKIFFNYTVTVQACETINCPLSTVEFTTLDKYPEVPENILSVDYENFVTFVSFHSILTQNINCSIEIRNVLTNTSINSRKINCVENGSIPNAELEYGLSYDVTYRIANTRGYNSTKPIRVFTPPNLKQQKEAFQVKKDETTSNATVISLLFPAINGSCNGTIYLVVSGEVMDVKECEKLVKLRKMSLNRTVIFRKRRGTLTEKNYFLLDETLPLGTPKYELQSDYSKKQEMDANGEIYISPVIDYQSGGYSKVVGYESNGPFWFEGSHAVRNWIVSLSFVVFVVLVIMMLRRKNMFLPKLHKLSIFYKHRGHEGHDSSSTYESNQNDIDINYEPEEEHILNKATNQAVELHVFRDRQTDSISTHKDEPLCDEEEIYGNVSPKVYMEDLEFFLIQNAYSPKLNDEYKGVPLIIPGKSTKVSKSLRNRIKNRYQNNPPYDDTRIVLPPHPDDPDSDYINANYIDIVVDHSGAMARYIPTQGPMQEKCDTVSDFWRMIWHEKVEAIVMVTNLVENGKLKCAQYWPEFNTLLQANDIEVSQDEFEEDKGSFIIRKFKVTRNGEWLRVAQYHFVEWSDHDVPLEASQLGEMIKIILANHPFGPTVIHCSAGIGRTGTLLLVILCLEELKLLKYLNMKKCFLRLRNCRPKLIQGLSQYQFAHFLLWVILFEHKTTFSNVDFVSSWYSTFEPNNLEEQFMKLKRFNKELTYSSAKRAALKKLNRYANILPADSRRVVLKGVSESETEQYINAVEIDGFNQQKAYIVAEHPLPQTLVRMWIMVLERQIPMWVLLNQFPDDDPAFPSVLPNEIEKCLSLGVVTIEFIAATEYEYFRGTTVRVYSHSEYYPNVYFDTTVIQLFGWKGGDELPSTGPDGLHSLLDYIRSIGPFTNPLFFSCLDGLTACGLALALDITRLRAQTFQEVSIFSSCIKITYNRPEFIVSKEQYQYLHEAMASYFVMQNEETYENVDEIF